MGGPLTMLALTVALAAMLGLGLGTGMLEKPDLMRCGACGRLRRGHICSCGGR
jgi:hypothetical protein